MTLTYFVLNHLWQSTLVAGVAWLACRTVLKANDPSVRFAVWLAASAKFLIPFAVLVDVGHKLCRRPMLTALQSKHIFDLFASGSKGLAIAPFPVPGSPQHSTDLFDAARLGLAAVWALGIGVLLWRWFAAWWRIKGTVRQGSPHGKFHGISVVVSPTVRDRKIEPGVFGLWQHTILLPEGLEAALTPSELNAVLLHEWNHVRRRDNLTSIVQMLAETIFWFYPVIWILGRCLSEERELACDRAVLTQTGPESAEAYVEAILKVCRLYTDAGLPCAAGITGANLRDRVSLILKNERPRSLGITRSWLLACAMFGAIVVPPLVGFVRAGLLLAQESSKFEVVSIKPNKSPDDKGTWRYDDHGHFTGENIPVKLLIMTGFKLKESQLSGLPKWADSEKYDVEAKVEGKASQEQTIAMLRELLVDRFNFKYHRSKKAMPVYSLGWTKGPIKAAQSSNEACPPETICGAWFARRNQIEGKRITMAQVADALTFQLDRVVIDKTGSRGTFDIMLTWRPEPEPGDKSDSGEGASIFTAIQEQLGLKLQASKAQVDTLVVDHIERPSEN